MKSDVGDFFDDQQSSSKYSNLKKLTKEQDALAAKLLNQQVSGDALSIGGVWEGFKWEPQLKTLSVLDLSENMLKSYAPANSKPIVGDLYTYDFKPASFDSIIFPLMLHHVAEGSWSNCVSRVEKAIERGRLWLKPGGTLFILEYCPHQAWNGIQRAVLPLTKSFLKYSKQPLVVMHTRQFFENNLMNKFKSVETHAISPEGVNPWTMFPVFMGVSWLKLPVAVYPKMHVFIAKSPLT